jgi:cysteine desulfurase
MMFPPLLIALVTGGCLAASSKIKPSSSSGPRRVYLDHNATTPTHPEVLEAMASAGTNCWANPSSAHADGKRARAHVDRARTAVAELVGLPTCEVIFTSGGTEANNLVLHAPFTDDTGGALVVSRIEHPSVVRAAEALERRGVAVGWVDVPESGACHPAAFAEHIDALAEAGRHCALVSLMAVNHETGVIQPVAELAKLAHERGLLLHVDAVQAVGKLPPLQWAAADIITLSAHKIRGPKGIGAIVTRPGIKLRPLICGGGQERGIRPGTQSAALAAGFAVAAELARRSWPEYAPIVEKRDRFELAALALGRRRGIDIKRNGTAPRAPHVSNLSWPGYRSPELCASLDAQGISVSSGAACSTGKASRVITAMAGPSRASSAVRISLGPETTDAELERALVALERALATCSS